MGRSSPSPVLLCGVKHVENKADTLTQGNKADHDRQHNGEQANDLVEDAAEHITGYDGAESGTGFSLRAFSFHNKIEGYVVPLVAGPRFELGSTEVKSVMLPLHNPAYSLRKTF